MQTINISLSERLKEFVDSQADSGWHSSESEGVRESIRHDEEHKDREKLGTLLCSEPTEMPRQDWDEIRHEALKQFEGCKSRTSA